MHRFMYRAMLAGWLALVLQAPAALAQNAAIAPQADHGIIEYTIESHDARFLDPQLLFDTFAGDALSRLLAAQEAAASAQTELEAAVASGTAAAEDLAALEAQLRQATDSQTSAEAEIATIADLVVRLSDDQVLDLNRSLDDALSSGLALTLDAALLERVIDGNYDKRQIDALAQGLEQEARLLAKGELSPPGSEISPAPAAAAAPAPAKVAH